MSAGDADEHDVARPAARDGPRPYHRRRPVVTIVSLGPGAPAVALPKVDDPGVPTRLSSGVGAARRPMCDGAATGARVDP